MFGENNDMSQGDVHHLDQSISLGFEGDGDVPLVFDDEAQEPTGLENQNLGNQGQAPAGDQSAFEDAFTDNQQAVADDAATEETTEQLIEKLRAKGINVPDPEVIDEEKEFNDRLALVEQSIKNTQEFLALSDTEIIKEKIGYDLRDKYNKTGRAHLIGTDEFELEVEAEADQYMTPAMSKIFADNIRRDVQAGSLAPKEAEKTKLLNEQSNKIENSIKEKQTALKGSFNKLFTNGFLGNKYDKETIQAAYDSVVKGEFATELKNNPDILAEFALFRLNREAIASRNGGKSYGEGVKDAVQAFKGNDSRNTSHLSAAMQKNAGRSQDGNKARDWSNVLDANSEDLKGKVII